MATWTLTGDSAHPIFASKNYVNQDAVDYGTFTASEMQALVERVIDGDPESYWQGSTASDSTDVVITLSLNQGSSLIVRSPDLIILQNINWKNFVGAWSVDNVTYNTIASLNYASGAADNAAADLIVNPSDISSAKYLRFTVSKTITANAKKKCGGIIACLGTVQVAGGYADDKIKYRETVHEVMLGDGTISREYIMRSAASYDFWGMGLSLLNVTTAELALLRAIKAAGDPFVFVPEPADRPRDAYLCHFDGAWGQDYENPVRSIGFRLQIKVKEVGSH
ncbi:MAG TPA: hypothetical protein VJ733_04470 [Candidatus Binatia bacterium]|nr:hypothetical protein [Candidatus Binatia bacterium]